MTPYGEDRLQRWVDNVLSARHKEYIDHLAPTPLASASRPKAIRDPLWGFHAVEPHVAVFLDAPLVQRLRYIKQTAFAYVTYPTLVHSRFEHSLGVFGVATRMLDALRRNQSHIEIPPRLREEVRLAALLHDVGHGPFSHASESVYEQAEGIAFARRNMHAPYSAMAPASEILAYHAILSPVLDDLWAHAWDLLPAAVREDGMGFDRERIAKMVVGNDLGPGDLANALRRIVNGPFDADKLDYLSRDCYYSGVRSSVDADRLIDQLVVIEPNNNPSAPDRYDLVIDYRGLAPLEQLIISRSQLYHQIYTHHKVRAATALLTRLLVHLRQKNTRFWIKDRVEGDPVPQYDGSLARPDTFLAIEDNDLLGRHENDPVARALVERLKLRRLPRRCLVVRVDCLHGALHPDNHRWLADPDSKAKLDELWGELADAARVRAFEADIATEEGTIAKDAVLVDVISEGGTAGFLRTAIRRASGEIVPLDRFYPFPTYGTMQEVYRGPVMHVFADEREQEVAWAAGRILERRGIRLAPEAFALAKVRPPPPGTAPENASS